MKELEVKAMLEDSRIPEQYKLSGRLSSEFLDGVEFAEQRIMESGIEAWLARDIDGFLCAYTTVPYLDRRFGTWKDNGLIENILSGYVVIERNLFPEVTYENSPKRARIILED